MVLGRYSRKGMVISVGRLIIVFSMVSSMLCGCDWLGWLVVVMLKMVDSMKNSLVLFRNVELI